MPIRVVRSPDRPSLTTCSGSVERIGLFKASKGLLKSRCAVPKDKAATNFLRFIPGVSIANNLIGLVLPTNLAEKS